MKTCYQVGYYVLGKMVDCEEDGFTFETEAEARHCIDVMNTDSDSAKDGYRFGYYSFEAPNNYYPR